MTEIEKKALALVNEVEGGNWLPHETDRIRNFATICRAIEQHEAFRQEVSDELSRLFDDCEEHIPFASKPKLRSFIIAKPDPLVEAVKEASNPDYDCASPEAYAEVLRAAMKNRGYEWTKIVEDK